MLADDVGCDFRAAQTEVRNQGARSTCAVFAATAAHEWMAGDCPDLSEEDALCSAKIFDASVGDATWVSSALHGIDSEGQALEQDWPYGNPHHTEPRPAPAAEPARRRCCGPVSATGAARAADVPSLLASGLAVILTVRFVPATWASASVDGWIDDPLPPTAGAHAVLAVGRMPAQAGQPDAVVFKNSWSSSWGRQGYGFMTDRYLAAHHQYTDVLGAVPE